MLSKNGLREPKSIRKQYDKIGAKNRIARSTHSISTKPTAGHEKPVQGELCEADGGIKHTANGIPNEFVDTIRAGAGVYAVALHAGRHLLSCLMDTEKGHISGTKGHTEGTKHKKRYGTKETEKPANPLNYWVFQHMAE